MWCPLISLPEVTKGKQMAKTKSKSKSKKKDTGAPQIITAKGGLPAGKFMVEILDMMEDDLRLNKQQAKDFSDSLIAVVERELGEGNPVNLFGLVKIVPRLHTKGVREVNSVFGDSESPKVQKKYPAKISIKSGQGIFTKKVKDALPSVQKLQKKLGG
jgi:hypothetical protein